MADTEIRDTHINEALGEFSRRIHLNSFDAVSRDEYERVTAGPFLSRHLKYLVGGLDRDEV